MLAVNQPLSEIRRPRPSPRPGRRLGPPQVWNLPQQAPQGQGHSNGFLWAFKAAVMGFQSCRLPACKRSKPSKTFQTLQTLQDLPNPPNTVPSRHPRAKATSRTGMPGPRPQQWLSMGFQSCRLPARKPSKTLQTPSPAGTPGPRPLPEQAPQGQGHSNGFLWAFKAAVCQPANAPNLPKPSKPSKPSKTFQTLQTPSPAGAPGPRPQQWLSIGFQSCRLPARKPSKTLQNPPNPPNTVPSRHPRAKATSRTGTPGPRPQQWLSIGFQSCRLPARKPSKTLQEAPQGQGHFPNRHPRAKATAMAFYRLSKLPFVSPQTLQNPPNTVPSRHPRAKATSRTGTPGPRPQQWLSMGFQSCRYGLSKLPFARPQTLQTFQNLPNPPNPPKPSKPSKHRPQQAPQGQGHFPNRHPRAKATAMAFYGLSKLPFASPQTLQNPPKPSKPSKHRPQQAPQGQGHFPNRHPRAKATAMAFYRLSKLPFASPQTLQTPSKTLQTLQNPPNPPNTFPNRHPSAKATSQTGTPGPRPQQWLSMGFQSCRLPARKPSKTLQTLQTPSPAGTPGQGHFPNRHPRAKAIAIAAACVRPIRLVLQEKAQWDGSCWTP